MIDDVKHSCGASSLFADANEGQSDPLFVVVDSATSLRLMASLQLVWLYHTCVWSRDDRHAFTPVPSVP